MPTNLPFYGFVERTYPGYLSANRLVEENIRRWLEMSFLIDGAFTTVVRNETDWRGNDLSQFLQTNDPIYGTKVYQCRYKNLVYETGVAVPVDITAPTIVSGIYVDNDFYPTSTTGVMEYHFDYINGRVIFENANAMSTVYGTGNAPLRANFSTKNIFVSSNDEMLATLLTNTTTDNVETTGVEFFEYNELYYPAVFIHVMSRAWKGAQLGGGKIARTHVNLYTFATSSAERDYITSTLSQQENKKIPTIDWNSAPSPLDEYNDRSADFTTFEVAASGYPWKSCYILDSEEKSRFRTTVYRGDVSYQMEIYTFM